MNPSYLKIIPLLRNGVMLGLVMMLALPARLVQAQAGHERIEVLIDRLGSDEASDRVEACNQLAAMGASAKQAMPALSRTLNDPEEEVQSAATRAMGKIEPEFVQILIKRLTHREAYVRLQCARALGRIGPPEATLARDALRRVAENDPHPEVRKAAAAALRRVEEQPQAPDAAVQQAHLAQLTRTLRASNDPDEIVETMNGIAAMGPAANQSAQLILDTIKANADSKPILQAGYRAITRIEPKFLEHMVARLDSPDPEHRRAAAQIIGWIGYPDANDPKILSKLGDMLHNHPEEQVKEAAAQAMFDIGEGRRIALGLPKFVLDDQAPAAGEAGAPPPRGQAQHGQGQPPLRQTPQPAASGQRPGQDRLAQRLAKQPFQGGKMTITRASGRNATLTAPTNRPKEVEPLDEKDGRAAAERHAKALFDQGRWIFREDGTFMFRPANLDYHEFTLRGVWHARGEGVGIEAVPSRAFPNSQASLKGKLAPGPEGGLILRAVWASKWHSGGSDGRISLVVTGDSTVELEQTLSPGVRLPGQNQALLLTGGPELQVVTINGRPAEQALEIKAGRDALELVDEGLGAFVEDLDRGKAGLDASIARNRVEKLLHSGWWEFYPDGQFRYVPHDNHGGERGPDAGILAIQGRYTVEEGGLRVRGEALDNQGRFSQVRWRIDGRLLKAGPDEAQFRIKASFQDEDVLLDHASQHAVEVVQRARIEQSP